MAIQGIKWLGSQMGVDIMGERAGRQERQGELSWYTSPTACYASDDAVVESGGGARGDVNYNAAAAANGNSSGWMTKMGTALFCTGPDANTIDQGNPQALGGCAAGAYDVEGGGTWGCRGQYRTEVGDVGSGSNVIL